MKKLILFSIIGIFCLAGCTFSVSELNVDRDLEVPAEIPAE